MQDKIPDYMAAYYNPFEQNLALAWAQSKFSEYLRLHPDAPLDDQEAFFLEAIEGGLGLSLKFRKQNA